MYLPNQNKYHLGENEKCEICMCCTKTLLSLAEHSPEVSGPSDPDSDSG